MRLHVGDVSPWRKVAADAAAAAAAARDVDDDGDSMLASIDDNSGCGK